MPPSPQAVTDGSKTWSPSHLFSSVVEGNDETTSTVAPAPAPEIWDKIHAHLQANEFRAAIASAFELPAGDNFTYHATASVNLAQAEAAIRAGRVNGLHGWYVERVSPPPAPPSAPATGGSDGVGENEHERGDDGENDDDKNNDGDKNSDSKDDNDPSEPRTIPGQPSLRISGYPPPADIQAYISLFDPTRSAANSLKSLAANAKKGSLRATVAEYLLSKRHLDASISVPKFKPSPVVAAAQQDGSNQPPPSSKSSKTTTRHENPALDFWAYSCMALEYAGPNANTALVKTSHHILPVYMHHFGCVCPSWEALQVIAKLASSISHSTSTGAGPTDSANSKNRGRRTPAVLDMGSGNGYWTLMLRRLGLDLDVVAVDSGQSRWRAVWIPDTHVADGVQYLRKRGGCPSSLLLLVYPIVGSGGGGSGTGEFTRRVLDAYTGDVVCVAGTQNGNGYTGFKDVMVDEYMARERPGWEKVAQVALPSFAGKDDALFAFRRRKKMVDEGAGQ
ncbi:hypothetical protein AYO20_00371 [Fonsecaea nubica]|uniref:Uncharacterized protein n=1 Tax=Fonsecaea nubica TaxID=856822 RepID=A0A178DHX5_9EURO|nr:hypothetical protein AYO20_00371 [Fonsecaea nubica]OAL40635.1 hypothetical protein AYO20_00371 [Fonsecaea nubica]